MTEHSSQSPSIEASADQSQDPDADSRSMMARRSFLRSVGLPVALLSIAAPLSSLVVREVRATQPADEKGAAAVADRGVTGQQRWGLLIDTAKCASGCDACVRGCHEEHGIEVKAPETGSETGSETGPEMGAETGAGTAGTPAQWIRKLELQDRVSKRETSLPMMCQHCDSAPCVDVCPTGASFKRADGVVLVNKHTCIGCRYCMMACPYKARSFIDETLTQQKSWAPRGKGTVESCTLCVHRIDRSGGKLQSACAEACSAEGHDAILFGDMNDPQSELAKKISARGAVEIRADLRLDTGVRYLSP